MLNLPFKLLRHIFWILILALAIVLCTNTTLAQNESDMNEACAWQGRIGQTVESAYIYAWANMWDVYDIASDDAQAILSLDVSNNFWVTTAEYGYFDTPDDETAQLLVLVFFTEQGKRRIYFTSAFSTPETYYAYLFLNLKPYATADGRYYGVHPCRVFRVDTQTINDFWYGASLRQN